MKPLSLHLGDCRDILPTLDADSIDACVTDPPYELGFMGKRWDASGVAYDVTLWREVLRVLKPGGHLLAFGGTRTYHRMACAIEDAGFEIRDQIHWLYATGFPKSLDIGKAIDKAAGAEREVMGVGAADCEYLRRGEPCPGHGDAGKRQSGATVHVPLTAPATDAACQWDGWGTALKPAHEPIVLARKPLSEGSVAANVLEWGTGGINVDACRVGVGAKKWEQPRGGIWRTDPAARAEMIDNPLGRWPPNLLLAHSPACVLLSADPAEMSVTGAMTKNAHAGTRLQNSADKHQFRYQEQGGEVWECHPSCPVAEIGRQSGTLKSGTGAVKRQSATGYQAAAYGRESRPEGTPNVEYGDTGTAARFFPTFHYCPKPGRGERDFGLDALPRKANADWPQSLDGNDTRGASPRANVHPTVKPVALMEWLCRLVTPPGGTVLDPFLGSGTTGIACLRLGFSFVGIEQDADYLEIVRGRLQQQLPLFVEDAE